MEFVYSIDNLNLTQMETISRALDFYSRMGMGQFAELTSLVNQGIICEREIDGVTPAVSVNAHEIRNLEIDELRRIAFPSLDRSHSSLGVGNPRMGEPFKIAADIQQVVRRQLAIDRNAGVAPSTFDGDIPFRWSRHALPTVTSIENTKNA
jgi:hypothetical protein